MKAWMLLVPIGGVMMIMRRKREPRGIRNNNPGNIRRGSSKWQGQSPWQTDSDFVQFETPAFGIRALAKTLKTYRSKYGLNTVEGIIGRWAPPVENDTKSYIDSVAKKIGVEPDEKFDLQEKMQPLVAAIIYHENGKQPYSEETIKKGVALA